VGVGYGVASRVVAESCDDRRDVSLRRARKSGAVNRLILTIGGGEDCGVWGVVDEVMGGS